MPCPARGESSTLSSMHACRSKRCKGRCRLIAPQHAWVRYAWQARVDALWALTRCPDRCKACCMHGLHGAPTYMQVADARGGPDDEQDDRDDGHHGHGDLSPSSCIAGDIRRRCRWFNRLARVIPLGLIGVGVDVEGLLGLVVHVDILSRGTRAAGNRGNRIENVSRSSCLEDLSRFWPIPGSGRDVPSTHPSCPILREDVSPASLIRLHLLHRLHLLLPALLGSFRCR